MPADERIALMVAALVPVLIVLPAVVWFRRRCDAVFAGSRPASCWPWAAGHRTRVGGERRERSGSPSGSPPDGMTPGLVGTVSSTARADVVDVSATLIDLAVRGLCGCPEPVDPAAPSPPPAPSHRGRFLPPAGPGLAPTRPAARAPCPGLPFETLLGRVFAQGPGDHHRRAKKRGRPDHMREAQIGLFIARS